MTAAKLTDDDKRLLIARCWCRREAVRCGECRRWLRELGES